jgi:hypothetical protein
MVGSFVPFAEVQVPGEMAIANNRVSTSASTRDLQPRPSSFTVLSSAGVAAKENFLFRRISPLHGRIFATLRIASALANELDIADLVDFANFAKGCPLFDAAAIVEGRHDGGFRCLYAVIHIHFVHLVLSPLPRRHMSVALNF